MTASEAAVIHGNSCSVRRWEADTAEYDQSIINQAINQNIRTHRHMAHANRRRTC